MLVIDIKFVDLASNFNNLPKKHRKQTYNSSIMRLYGLNWKLRSCSRSGFYLQMCHGVPSSGGRSYGFNGYQMHDIVIGLFVNRYEFGLLI